MCTNLLGETCLHSVAKSVYNLNCGIELLDLVAEWEDANNGECVSLQVTDANDNNLLHLASLAGNEALSSKSHVIVFCFLLFFALMFFALMFCVL